ncbi:hypothetical protein [Streptomyces sp. MP131-18]|uniref:hypothetical protein n=1 Tax=Streptomyces sp. MP131-18 TaxID=1857892 RepID=UPI0009CB2D37|nr:hypothetical protein [Streptomyces sp. MP131-18]ONK13187.1 hypothetical protein STBA_39500 [Streptomyces sp. MP131-18]
MAEAAERDHRQRTGWGRVCLTVTGSLQRPAYDPFAGEEWQRTVACPECGTSTGLTLEALDDVTVAICPPADACGRAWLADDVFSASQIRQMHHLKLHGETMTTPDRHRVAVILVPDMDGDSRALQDDPTPDPEIDDPYTWWAINSSAVVRQHTPPLVVAMGWARGLLAWSLPHDGEIYEHLYPPAGGSALDAHMTQVVLALALHEAAWQEEQHDFGKLSLEAAMAELEGDRAARLRGVRPLGLGNDGGRLRLSDITRLEAASNQHWQLWCRLAGEVLAGHSQQERLSRVKDERGSTFPPTKRTATHPVLLARRSSSLPGADLDFTWYQDHHLPS